MPRWFKITLWCLGGMIIATGALMAYVSHQLSNIDWNIPVYKEFSARDAILLELSNPECLTRETVIAQSNARGWDVENAPSLGTCESPEGISDWLKVRTEDGFLLPDNQDNLTYFGFDENGCSVYLRPYDGIDGFCPAIR